MPRAEVVIDISYQEDDDPAAIGISFDAERLVSESYMLKSESPESVIEGLAYALEEAARTVRARFAP